MKKLNPNLIIKKVVKDFSPRSKDVLLSRFGIGKNGPETLESIGQRYGITRERVRQIEEASVRSIVNLKKYSFFTPLNSMLKQYILRWGGLVSENKILNEFADYYKLPGRKEEYNGSILLALTLNKNFSRIKESSSFYALWLLDNSSKKLAQKVVNQAKRYLDSVRTTVSKDKMLSYLESFNRGVAKNAIESYLDTSKEINKNIFGEYGISHWSEVSPRGVKDRAYLVLKKEEKPLHFTKVAELINNYNFSTKQALSQTVHNELIKDNRFVLVGRGTYALRDWGYEEGTVKDVLVQILKNNPSLTKEQIIEKVLEKRQVKENTILLNLQNSGKFVKDKNGRYSLLG